MVYYQSEIKLLKISLENDSFEYFNETEDADNEKIKKVSVKRACKRNYFIAEIPNFHEKKKELSQRFINKTETKKLASDKLSHPYFTDGSDQLQKSSLSIYPIIIWNRKLENYIDCDIGIIISVNVASLKPRFL